MKPFLLSLGRFGLAMAVLAAPLSCNAQTRPGAKNAANHAANQAGVIPMDQLGAVVGKQYQGEGLSVSGTGDGARLRCGFQRLEGRATAEGLWLESTAPGGGKLRLLARAVGRESSRARQCALTEEAACDQNAPTDVGGYGVLARTGTVSVADKLVRFIRPGLTEEYSVGVDGVRQDFVVAERPAGAGDLRVELALSGARAEAAVYGAKLTLEGPGRALAYSRLRVEDATGHELRARLEVLSASRLAARVADGNATYPVRIDPTFSNADWVSLNPGMPGANDPVLAIAVDGTGNVYVGGRFGVIGTVAANCIAKWDGTAWSALGRGMSYVNALAVSGTDLYAGGFFTTAGGVAANYIAKWDGSAWSALGSGMNSEVEALAVSGTNLYAGGYFTTAGGGAANRIAKWDGSAWSALGSGMDGGVRALAVSGADLYAGGYFTTAGGVAATNIAKWDGSAWSALGSGMAGALGGYYPYVSALAVSGTDLYAGGEFTTAGGVTANYIAKWNGSAWSALGSGMGGTDPCYVSALAVSGSDLYAGGYFTTAAGVPASSIAKWDGHAWSALGSGMHNTVAALAASGTNLYAGGYFSTAGGVAANYIAKWNGSAWSALGSWMNSEVEALAVSGTSLYAGGTFTTAGGGTANYIAKWDGSAWSALGSGVDDIVWALAVSGTDLYAGGWFTTAGGVAANRIAKWDGSAWSALGSGMNGTVEALAVSGTNLYAGGWFSTAGGLAATNIAKWDGSAWSALGSRMDGGVEALAVSGTNLYAGGYFTTAGGVTANYIAKWDGSAWSALGQGMGGVDYPCVRALAVSGSDLYAGGGFTTAGGAAATNIAKWDGSAWSALGSRMDGGVVALAVSGGDLYAGGSFSGYITKWDGSAWSALGSGVNWYVYALAADGSGHLFVGGKFYFAGTNLSPFIAQANIGGGVSGGRLGSLAYSPVRGFSCTFSDATLGQAYRIQASPSLAAGSWSDLTNFVYSGPMVISDPAAGAAARKFYRAVSR